MKVTAINGSARKDGNTAILIKNVLREIEKDEEGLRTMKVLGENMAWMMKKLYA